MRGRSVAVGAMIVLACACQTTSAQHVREGNRARSIGKFDEAAAQYRAALAAPQDDVSDRERVRILYDLGSLAPDPEEGVLAFNEALRMIDAGKAPPGWRAETMRGLGARLRQAGRCEEAKAVLADAVARVKGAENWVAGGILVSAANAEVDCGDLLEARALYLRALGFRASRAVNAAALRGLASVALLRDELEMAAHDIEQALVEQREAGGYYGLVAALDLQSCIHRRLGDGGAARTAAAEAEEIVERNPRRFSYAGARGSPVLDRACP